MSLTVTGPAARFLANQPALDFLNTAPVEGGAPVEQLVSYGALVSWLEEAKLLGSADAKKARSLWSTSPVGAKVLERAIALREMLRSMIERLGEGAPPSAAALSRLNTELRSERGAYLELRRTEHGLERVPRVALDAPDDVLAPLLHAVVDLFTEVDLSLVRKCEDASCVLYFHDTTRNHKRRWCSMETCGNRHKVNAFRTRVSGG